MTATPNDDGRGSSTTTITSKPVSTSGLGAGSAAAPKPAGAAAAPATSASGGERHVTVTVAVAATVSVNRPSPEASDSSGRFDAVRERGNLERMDALTVVKAYADRILALLIEKEDVLDSGAEWDCRKERELDWLREDVYAMGVECPDHYN